MEHASVADRHADTARWATAMPRTALTGTPDDPGTGGLCRVATAPVRHGSIVAHRAQARDPDAWHALLAPALAPLPGEGRPATSAAAPGLVADVAPPLGAPPSPDLCHVPQALSTALWAPLAPQERAADTALSAARAPLAQGQAQAIRPKNAARGAPPASADAARARATGPGRGEHSVILTSHR